MKRSIYVLAVALVATFAYSFSGGDGTEGDPYQISTPVDLEAVSSNPAGHFALVNDIDLDGVIYTNAVIFHFWGSFDGNGFAIRNLKIDAGSSNVGLFGQTGYSGLIKNLKIWNFNISGRDYVGGLVGKGGQTKIINCHSKGIASGRDYVGGLVGDSEYSPIKNSYSSADVYGSGNYVGGLVGKGGQISNSIAKGSVSGTVYVGGLVGYSTGYSTVSNSYAWGNTSGTGTDIGGLIGYKNAGKVENCYSLGLVSGSSSVGGMIGYNYNAIVTKCFWNTQSSETTISAGGTGKTTEKMQDINTFISAGWDFENIWIMSDIISEFEGYPILKRTDFNVDLNFDGIVDFDDLIIFIQYWLLEGQEIQADINNDGVVDLLDYALLAEQWLMEYQEEKPIVH